MHKKIKRISGFSNKEALVFATNISYIYVICLRNWQTIKISLIWSSVQLTFCEKTLGTKQNCC